APAGRAHVLDEILHVELALAAELAVLGRLDVRVGHGVRARVAVVELDADAVLQREAGDGFVGDANLLDMPEVEEDAAVLGARSFDELARRLEGVDDAERHHLEGDFRAVALGLFAEAGKALDQARHGAGRADEVAHLHAAGAQHLGRLEQEALALIRAALRLAIEEPVAQEFELDVPDAMVIENAPHVGEAQPRERVLEIGVPDAEAREPGLRGARHALLEARGAELVIGVRLGADRERPVRSEQVDVSVHWGEPSSRGITGTRLYTAPRGSVKAGRAT